MYKGTTPTYTLTLPEEVDLTDATSVRVTFANRRGVILTEKTGTDLVIDRNVIQVFLSQEETLGFPEGTVSIQVNWLYSDQGVQKRAASNIAKVYYQSNLINEVI